MGLMAAFLLGLFVGILFGGLVGAITMSCFTVGKVSDLQDQIDQNNLY